MAATVGTEVGELLAEAHRVHGVELKTDACVTGLLEDGGRACGVRLDDGAEIAGDTILVAIGAAPAVAWLRGSTLDLSDGVGCDAFCAAAPGIYAAGDVACWHHPSFGRRVRSEHRMNATEQGTAAAQNLLAELDATRFGTRRQFAPVPYFWSDQYRIKLQAYGDLAAHDQVALHLLDKSDPAAPRAVALYRHGDCADGALAVGLPPRQARGLRALVAEPQPWHQALDQLTVTVG
jgi:NADPH-dependent 2,4-dienoyl-CoA reductase/sulfur reductase-like enzyme